MPYHGYVRTRGVRYNQKTSTFEMWCPDCAMKKSPGGTFWPISEEYWNIHNGLSRCRACWTEKKRRDERGRKADKREQILAANRAYYAENRELLRWKDNMRKKQRRERQASAQ